MVKVIIDWGEDLTKIDEFSCNYAVGRAVFTLLSKMSDTWAKWQSKTKDSVDVYLCDPEKNENCQKTICQKECFFTRNKEFAKTDILYRYDGKKFNGIIVEAGNCDV